MALDELKIDDTDYHREGITWAKLVHVLNVFFNKKATEVLDSVDKFSHIDFEKHKANGKQWIILDIDDCVAPHHGKIYETNMKMIRYLLEKEWDIIVYSNMKKSDRYDELEEMWIDVITSKYAKPNSKWFEECLEKTQLEASEVIMIWDNFLTDWGAIWAGIEFIKVKPIEIEEINPSVWRKIQKTMRTIAEKVAKLHWNI